MRRCETQLLHSFGEKHEKKEKRNYAHATHSNADMIDAIFMGRSFGVIPDPRLLRVLMTLA